MDEEEDDVLINVNIVDDERAEKNVENKKKKPDYKPYDEPQFDEYGMVCCYLFLVLDPTCILRSVCMSSRFCWPCTCKDITETLIVELCTLCFAIKAHLIMSISPAQFLAVFLSTITA